MCFLWPLSPSIFHLPEERCWLREAKQPMWQGDSRFHQKYIFFLFFCWLWRANLFLTLLPHPHVLHNCLKVAAPAVGEEQANACVGESAKMSWWSSSTGLRCCIWNWPPVSLDVSRKRHSSQVTVPEDLPTIPPCKRFARLLVTMMLRMCSKIFFAYNSNCFHICPKSTFVKHLCDSGLRLLQRNWSC